MLHQTPTRDSAEPMADWREQVAVGDLIRWPLGGSADQDSLALVVDIETIGAWRVLTVAPGIDDVTQAVQPGTLRLTRLDEVRDAGLAKPVRFGCPAAAGQMRPLAWSNASSSRPNASFGGRDASFHLQVIVL